MLENFRRLMMQIPFEVMPCTYTTTGASQNVQILYKKEYAESVEIIETGEMLDVTGSGALNYTFAEAGEHLVKIKFKKDVTSFSYCFYDCSKLTSIPGNLFANNPNVTDFTYCFYYCSSLTAIPEGLFTNCPNVKNFRNCFYYCSSLTAIPEGLFTNCPNVTSFSYCFYYCLSLTSIPENLFANNTSVTNFNRCFYRCSSLTGTTPKDSDGGELWERVGKDGYPLSIDGSDCFANCAKLSNYSKIPSGWK